MINRKEVEAIRDKPSGTNSRTIRRLAMDWLEKWDILYKVAMDDASKEGFHRGRGHVIMEHMLDDEKKD